MCFPILDATLKSTVLLNSSFKMVTMSLEYSLELSVDVLPPLISLYNLSWFKDKQQYILIQNKMPNYENGKIYKIVCNITNECYIGSTCEPTLARRLATHVLDYRKWKNGKRCKTMSFDIIDREDYNIYLIIAYPCNSKDELTSKEG